MLTLDLTNEPRWLELAAGVRVQLRPLSTALMIAARSDPAVADLPAETSDEVGAVAFAKVLGRLAILAWEGVGNAEGNPIEPTPEAIEALLEVWPVFEAFQLRYVSKGLLLEQEKNGSAPLPTGTSAGAGLLRSVPRAVPRLPGAAEPTHNPRRLAGLGPGAAAWRSAPRYAWRRARLGHGRGAHDRCCPWHFPDGSR
jgi:hypothetical protein